MACKPARRIGSGVSKSGSPAESSITGRPARRRALARALTASVAEGRMAATRGLISVESKDMGRYGGAPEGTAGHATPRSRSAPEVVGEPEPREERKHVLGEQLRRREAGEIHREPLAEEPDAEAQHRLV